MYTVEKQQPATGTRGSLGMGISFEKGSPCVEDLAITQRSNKTQSADETWCAFGMQN